MKSYSDKRILVAGAGAIGSFYGGLLSKKTAIMSS